MKRLLVIVVVLVAAALVVGAWWLAGRQPETITGVMAVGVAADPDQEEVLEFRMIEVAEVQPPTDEAAAAETADEAAEEIADADEEEVLQFEMIEVAEVQPPADEAAEEAVEEVAEEVVEEPAAPAETPVPPVLQFTMTTLDGRQKDLADYQGKVLLVVNTASQCGFTGQYAGLQQLHERFAQQGLVVMGFPANNFGSQEPGSDPQIAQFCKANFGVTFDMFSKISVAGADRHAFYNVLTAAPVGAAGVRWNFEKFLIARDGTIIGHYPSQVDPSALAGPIQQELGK